MATDTPTQDARIWQTFWESPLPVKTILLGTFVNTLGGFLLVFLVLYLRAKGYSVEESTAAVGLDGAGSVIGLLIGGALAARLGPRAVTVLSMTGAAVFTIALLYLPNYPLIAVDVVLIGLVGRIFGPTAATLLSSLTPADRQVMIFALSRFGFNLGITAAPLLGTALYYLDHHRFTLVFWGDGITSLAYAVLALLVLPDLPARARQPAGAAKGSLGYAAVFRNRRYAGYLIAAFIGVAVYVQYQTVLPLDVTAHHIAIFWYTLAVSINGLIVIGVELLVTKVAQKWPLRVTIGLAYGLIAAGVSLYGLPLVPAVIVVATLVWTLGEILGGPATFAYAAMAGPASMKSYYIASFQFVFGLGTALGPLAGGVLFASLGHKVWPLFGIAEAAGLVLILTAVRTPTAASPGETGSPAGATAPAEAPAPPDGAR